MERLLAFAVQAKKTKHQAEASLAFLRTLSSSAWKKGRGVGGLLVGGIISNKLCCMGYYSSLFQRGFYYVAWLALNITSSCLSLFRAGITG